MLSIRFLTTRALRCVFAPCIIARLLAAGALLFAPAPGALACLAPELDARAVQWSNQVVEARLVSVSDRIRLRKVLLRTPREKHGAPEGPGASAEYWYRLYSFEVTQVFEGSVKPKYRVEVVRLFGEVHGAAPKPVPAEKEGAPPSGPGDCPNRGGCEQLTLDAVGRSFILLLRPEQDVKAHRPPVWDDAHDPDVRDGEMHAARAYAPIRVLPREKLGRPELADLKTLLSQTRSAEKKIPDPEVKKLVEIVAQAPADDDARPAADALRAVGYKAVKAIKSGRDARTTPAAGKERLARLAIELSPPPFHVAVGEFRE